VPVSFNRMLAVVAVIIGLLPGTFASAGAVVLTTPTVTAADEAAPEVGDLRVNGLTDPLGIGGENPLLSWTMNADRRGVTQTAYRIRVAHSADALSTDPVWDSGKVLSGKSVDVGYEGPDLRSQQPYVWSVKIWDDAGQGSGWSEPGTFETGILDASEWQADWIGAPARDLVGPEWTDYTIEFTASEISGALGVYFRGRDTEHAYMWQFSEAEGALRPHVKNPGYSVLPATPFPAGFDFAAEHDYSIEVSGTTIATTVDGKVLDTRNDSTHTAPGVMGFRTSGAETGLVHDVTVTSANGEVLVDTDFPRGDRTFTAGTVTDRGLRVDANGPEAWVAVPDEVPLLRTEFDAEDKEVTRARVYASAHGVYELELNGERVGDHELAPGWTDYRKRVQHQTYDVTDQIRAGANALGAQVSHGWYSGRVAMFGEEIYGERDSVIAQLRIDYADGTSQLVTTDDSWRTTPGPITSADLLDGESYDARRAQAVGDWTEPGYDAADWQPVDVLQGATEKLEPQDDQPVRVTQELAATQLESPDPNTYIYDLGQNMVGVGRFTLSGSPGDTARIRYAEVLNPDGSMYTANLRSAKATDYYTFASSEPETYEPTFTFHGFRYVEITGLDQAPPASAITGVVMGTDGDLVSQLSTSSPLVNQLHSNIVWGMRGNFLSIPTDTPARDERMGWTGDINVFARTAVYNMDSQAFLNKWLKDLRDTQNEAGAFPGVAPVIPGRFDGGYGPAGWADAGVHVPWTLWQAYGDTQVIHENYDAMKRYVDYLDRDSTNHIRSAGGYLDWLNLDDPTPADVLDTAFVAKSTREFAQMAAAVGREADASAYMDRYRAIRQAYQDAFIAADGTVKGDSQTAYILTIINDLAPADKQQQVADQFVETLERRDFHLSTGFLGVDGLLPALTEIGRTDIAYRLLQNDDYPSWGYEIGKGATTIWERWNSIMPDGSFGPVGMNSFNHYAYGAVGEWMYRTMAGVSALKPGYRKILIAPETGEGITFSDFSHRTPYGTVTSAWRHTDDGFELDVTVPGNSTAEVHVPAKGKWEVTEGGRPAYETEDVTFLRMEDGAAVLVVGSGNYEFATDAVLGRVGAARDGVGELQALVSDSELAGDARDHLDAQVGKLDREVDDVWTSYVDDGGETTASGVHRALSTVANLQRWLATQETEGVLDPATAVALQDTLGDVDRHLSAASGLLVGAVAGLVPADGEALPGNTVSVEVTVENRGQDTLRSLGSSVDAPAGWTVTPSGSHAGTVAPGETAVHRYDVAIPGDADPGAQELTGSVTYQHRSATATLPVSATLLVVPAVVVASVVIEPAEAQPGDVVTVRTVLRNRSDSVATGNLVYEVPDGWATPSAETFEVPASGTSEVESRIGVPLEVTQGVAQIGVAVGETADERAQASLGVVFENPPADATDHVDLGDAASEQAHALRASPASGTNVEAGLTRRYTNSAQPGGWFEMEVAVPTDGRFLLRSVETFDGPQFKTYDVLVDGEVVHERRFRRATGGPGSLSYQFLVEESAASADGVVTLRFQDVDADYDPSIADVWVIPAG
jgi:alpha-L-rhamnosidase